MQRVALREALLRRTGTPVFSAASNRDPGSAAHRHSASKTRVNALMARAARCAASGERCNIRRNRACEEMDCFVARASRNDAESTVILGRACGWSTAALQRD